MWQTLDSLHCVRLKSGSAFSKLLPGNQIQHIYEKPYASHLPQPRNKVTRLLSTREKSIKIENLTWYLQCFVCIIIPGPALQKYAKPVFHPEQLGFLVFLVMSVDELVYVFPQV